MRIREDSSGIATMRRLPAALALLCATVVGLPLAAQTRPGSAPGAVVANTATVVFTLDGDERRVPSNRVTLVVAERLDIALAPGGATPALIAPSTPLAVQLTNGGTGRETFAIDAQATVPAATVTGIAVDVDGDGRFDPAIDTVLAGATPPLDPGQTLRLLILVAPVPGAGGTGVDGAVRVTARATTGSGTPADALAAAGDDGSDAVIGNTGATATVDLPFVARAPDTPDPDTQTPDTQTPDAQNPDAPGTDAPSLVKTQSVRAADGSSRPVGGAVVTYTLVARFPGATRDARIDDPIPAGTRYVPGSLTLDDTVLTDAAGDDAGGLEGNGVAVTLGDVPAAATRTVRFQVRLP